VLAWGNGHYLMLLLLSLLLLLQLGQFLPEFTVERLLA
jgi:hypothetical protein